MQEGQVIECSQVSDVRVGAPPKVWCHLFLVYKCRMHGVHECLCCEWLARNKSALNIVFWWRYLLCGLGKLRSYSVYVKWLIIMTVVITVILILITHSLTHWTAWPATGRCALQTSRSLAMSQAASAASPTSTPMYVGDDLVDVSTPVWHQVGDQHGCWQPDEVLHRWYCSLQTTYMTEYRDSPVSDSVTDALLLSLAHYWRIWHKVESIDQTKTNLNLNPTQTSL